MNLKDLEAEMAKARKTYLSKHFLSAAKKAFDIMQEAKKSKRERGYNGIAYSCYLLIRACREEYPGKSPACSSQLKKINKEADYYINRG